MLNATPRSLLALVTAMAMATAAPALAVGPALLTVSGEITDTNRGPVDPETDKLFLFNEVSFDKAKEFDLGMLETLPQTTVHADFPKGGEQAAFTGPLLKDVLAAAGASGENVLVQAMDGYAIAVSVDELVDKGAVVALERDGKALGIGGLGPTQIVFPRAARPELADMPDDWWVWQIYHIKVE
jgi:hypothetical protein